LQGSDLPLFHKTQRFPPCDLFDQIGMAIGRRANCDGLNLVALRDLVDCADLKVIGFGDALCGVNH
jgi:hypothetical protein